MYMKILGKHPMSDSPGKDGRPWEKKKTVSIPSGDSTLPTKLNVASNKTRRECGWDQDRDLPDYGEEFEDARKSKDIEG